MNKDTKDYLFRILKTFIEAFLTSLVVLLKAGGINLKDKATVYALIIGALSSGVSAVLNINKLTESEEM